MDHDAAIGGPARAFEAAASVLLDAIDTLVLVLDANGRIVLANRAIENLVGLSVEKMLGQTPFELGVAPREPCADDADGDVQVVTSSGATRMVAWSSHVLRAPDGSLQYVVATGRDVTEARATEQRLQASERRFRELAENVNDLVAELDENGVFTYVNKRFEEVLGWPRESFVGRPVGEHMHLTDLALARAGIGRLRKGPEDVRMGLVRVRHKNGGYRCLEAVGRSFVGPEGQLRLAVISRDITERVNTEEQLRRVDRLVALGTFAAGVAHEINNPVAAILLAAEVALERPGVRSPESPALATLESIAAHARRCGSIVNAMLDFAAHGRSERKLHEINVLVGRALSLVEAYAGEHAAGVELVCAPGPLLIRANDVEIEQVLVNLVRNAVESGGGTSVVVKVETRRAGERVEIRVTDNGAGIPADARELVFEPFFSSKRASGGTGLGLAIARRIVGEHGGDIRIEDPGGKGIRFVVELPLDGQPPG